MGYLSAEIDIAHSLEAHWRETLTYTPAGGLGGTTVVEQKTGTANGLPYGDVYREGDVFLEEAQGGVAGRLLYVASSTPGNPTITLQPDRPQVLRRPRVAAVTEATWPRVLGPEVFIGIKTKPDARYGVIPALHAARELHQDGNHMLITEPFWKGGFYVHVEAHNRYDITAVTEMINRGFDYTTRIYKFLVEFRPVRFELRNYEINKRWKSVLNVNAYASVTPETPLDDLPNGMPDVFWPWTAITGVSPVLAGEDYTPAEKVGDYDLDTSDGVDENNFPPTWPPQEEP